VEKSIKNEHVLRNISRWLRETIEKTISRTLIFKLIGELPLEELFLKELSSSNSLEELIPL